MNRKIFKTLYGKDGPSKINAYIMIQLNGLSQVLHPQTNTIKSSFLFNLCVIFYDAIAQLDWLYPVCLIHIGHKV